MVAGAISGLGVGSCLMGVFRGVVLMYIAPALLRNGCDHSAVKFLTDG